ncbi:hypothetical protein ABIE51_001431 [Lysobacter sp. OAE881]|uniref:hypothetical protein n=1 Tax=Lysobacter sp. OAE881 TaxID=2663813 RepID=UPI0033981D9C
MRDFGKVSPMFWTGKTGKELRGHPEAQIVAMYLMTCPHSNMIGVYHLPKLYLCHETGLPLEGANKGLEKCIAVGFCLYDEDTETMFVIEMAAHQIGETLKPGDRRGDGIRRQVTTIASPSISAAFLERYADAYELAKPPSSPLEAPLQGALQSSEGGLEGAPKGLASPLSLSPSLSPSLGAETKRSKTRKTRIPDGFGISDRVRRWAAEKGHGQLEQRLEHFIGAAKARGYEYADWDEAFMGAIRDNWAKLAAPSASSYVPGGGRPELGSKR